jgi:hypothetical protein
MAVQNLTTARFVLKCLLDELEEYDRCIPVARNVQVGDVADALLAFMGNREILRLTLPAKPAPRRRRPPAAALPAVAKRKSRVSRTA